MTLLLDTHVLIWIATGNARLSKTAHEAVTSPGAVFFVSAINAYEYCWQWQRARFAASATLGSLLERLHCEVLDYPSLAWPIVERLPMIHGDPIDRMMIAHALVANMTIVTCDQNVAKYPVPTLW